MASVGPVLLGTAIAAHEFEFHLWVFALTLGAALMLQIASNLVNDYFDFKKGADTESRKGPTRAMQAGLITKTQMKRGIALVFAAIVALGAALTVRGGLPILTIGLVSMASAALYTAGPYPLAYLGLGDLFVFIFFGPTAVAGTYFLETGHWGIASILAGIPVGLFSIAILTVNNVRDFAEDKAVDKRTLVVRLGPTYGRMQYTFCLALPFLISAAYVALGYFPVSTLISFALLPLCIPMVRKIWADGEPRELNPLLGHTARLLALYSFGTSAAWFIHG
jgi:1,4-dihydroxy-2-naphthoate octaprenyltransferase